MVLLCDGRLVCGCADPYGKRVLGDTRHESVTAVWTGERATSLRADLNGGGSKFCGDCPLKLPLKKDEPSPQRGARRAGAALAPLHRVHGGLQHLVRPGVLRPRDRHHPHAPGRHARLRSLPPRRRRSRPVARAHRLLQLRRGVPPQARGRDVRVHQARLSAHLSLHEHQRPRVHRGAGPAAGALGDRRGHVLDRRRDRRELRALPAARRFREGDPQPALRGRREAGGGRDLPFINWRYILFTHNDSDAEMALARELAADIGVDRLCWELTDHPEDMFSRRFVPGLARPRRHQDARSGTTATSATRSPARRRARRSRSGRTARWRRRSADSRTCR